MSSSLRHLTKLSVHFPKSVILIQHGTVHRILWDRRFVQTKHTLDGWYMFYWYLSLEPENSRQRDKNMSNKPLKTFIISHMLHCISAFIIQTHLFSTVSLQMRELLLKNLTETNQLRKRIINLRGSAHTGCLVLWREDMWGVAECFHARCDPIRRSQTSTWTLVS